MKLQLIIETDSLQELQQIMASLNPEPRKQIGVIPPILEVASNLTRQGGPTIIKPKRSYRRKLKQNPDPEKEHEPHSHPMEDIVKSGLHKCPLKECDIMVDQYSKNRFGKYCSEKHYGKDYFRMHYSKEAKAKAHQDNTQPERAEDQSDTEGGGVTLPVKSGKRRFKKEHKPPVKDNFIMNAY